MAIKYGGTPLAGLVTGFNPQGGIPDSNQWGSSPQADPLGLALAARSQNTTNQGEQDIRTGPQDAFTDMKSMQNIQSGASPWAPMFQSWQERGISGVKAGASPQGSNQLTGQPIPLATDPSSYLPANKRGQALNALKAQAPTSNPYAPVQGQ